MQHSLKRNILFREVVSVVELSSEGGLYGWSVKATSFSMTSPTILFGVEAPAVTATLTGPVAGSHCCVVRSSTLESVAKGRGGDEERTGRCRSSLAEARQDGSEM